MIPKQDDDYIEAPTTNLENTDDDLPVLDFTSDEASDWIQSFGNTQVKAIPVDLRTVTNAKDVSTEKRDNSGKWTKGGLFPGSPKEEVVQTKRIAERDEPRQAKMLGTSVKTLQSKTDANIHKLANSGKLVMGMPQSALHQVFKDGKFKNQLETGTSSGGLIDPYRRKHVEYKLFGIDKEAPAENRPVYVGLVDPRLEDEHLNSIKQYGNTIVHLKDNVKNRSTYTVGDSFDTTNGSTSVRAIPFNQKEGARYATEYGAEAPDKNRHPANWRSIEHSHLITGQGYWEGQVHGGLTPEDIDHVQFKFPPNEELKQHLDKHKIKYTVHNPEDDDTYLEAPTH